MTARELLLEAARGLDAFARLVVGEEKWTALATALRTLASRMDQEEARVFREDVDNGVGESCCAQLLARLDADLAPADEVTFTKDSARHVASPALPPQPGPSCEPWCGLILGDARRRGASGYFRDDDRPGFDVSRPVRVFCTPACRDAGRPLNPQPEKP